MNPKYATCQNKKYLAWIRKKNCRTCGVPGPVDAHHVFCAGKKGYGNDALALNLCRKCHSQYHSIEWRAFEEFWNLDLKDEVICLLSEFLDEDGK